ncbi:MAG: DUF4013 domain-containing protein [Vulcanimicrobiota bacterium]
MNLDLSQALAFPRRDPEMARKLLIGGALAFVSGGVLNNGYMLEVARNRARGLDDSELMPEWNAIEPIVMRTLYFIVGVFLLLVPTFVYLALAMAAGFGLAQIDQNLGGLTAVALLLPALPFGFIIVTLVMIRGTRAETFGCLFKLSAWRDDVARLGWSAIFRLTWLCLVINVLMCIVSLALMFTLVGGLLVVFVALYAQVAMGHLIGQALAQVQTETV